MFSHLKFLFCKNRKTLFLSIIIGMCIALVFISIPVTFRAITKALDSIGIGSDTQEEINHEEFQAKGSPPYSLLEKPFFDGQIDGNSRVYDSKMVLDKTIIPMNDRTALASKYRNIKKVPVRLLEPPILYDNGTTKGFWVLDVDKNIYNHINAKLVYQTPHVYFWVEDDMDFLLSDLKYLVNDFENNIYPNNRNIFGSEWLPGVDNDEHLTILYAHHLGGAAGYFSATDSLMREIEKYSNLSEMFYLSADFVDLGEEYASSVLAHEFQHMIHWNIDRNESSWINEGLSELAVDLNGFSTGGFSNLFSANPNIQLNFWPGNEQGNSTPHYGASYLFIKYLYERFGEGFIHDLIAQPEDGLRGLDALLAERTMIEDEPQVTSENIFQDWTVANILQKESPEDGIYHYGNNDVPIFLPAESIVCDSPPEEFIVSQFGTTYFEIVCNGDYEIIINWENSVKLHTEDAFSGDFSYWSNSGDESAMRLRKEFDLSEVAGNVELLFKTWFDIEQDYDYLYVNVSQDGENWENLETPDCTKDDPTGSNLGCGYNGKSNGWLEQTVDLSSYVGELIFVEFEYITDAAVNGEGFFLDDVKLEAVGFFDDFEGVDKGWISEGFVRINNSIPQIMGITIISSDQDLNIDKYILSEDSEFSFTLNQNENNNSHIAVISGLTRYTKIPAQYQISVVQLN
jgi:immune inhibitor A